MLMQFRHFIKYILVAPKRGKISSFIRMIIRNKLCTILSIVFESLIVSKFLVLDI